MKKTFFLFGLFLVLAVYGFGQNNLTTDQIRNYANELGVPYEALQRLVDSYRPQTGLSNPNVNESQSLSIQELNFMRESDMLKIDYYYRIRATFSQNGRTVLFYAQRPDSGVITAEVPFLVNIPQNTLVDALIGVKADYAGRPRELFIVEIVTAR
jgi:hypothetical protein